jgi:hypothetical protein
MLRGCILALVFYLALAVGYFLWFDTVADWPENVIGAGVMALLVLISLGALYTARLRLRDWSLLSAARHGARPVDGKMAAVAGTIHPVSQPLRAPFSGVDCVLCEYDVSRERQRVGGRQESKNGVDFTGFLMNPCVIRTPHGDVRLLGFPMLTGFDKHVCTTLDAALSARDFLSATPFEDYSGVRLVNLLSVFGEVWSDEDGQVRKNMRLGKLDPQTFFPADLEQVWMQSIQESAAQGILPSLPAAKQNPPPACDRDPAEPDEDQDNEEEDEDWEEDLSARVATTRVPTLVEQRVDVGVHVCAIGVYDQARDGLRPRSGRLAEVNRLVQGRPEKLEQEARASMLRHLVGGILGLIVLHAAAYGIVLAARQKKEENNAPAAVVDLPARPIA